MARQLGTCDTGVGDDGVARVADGVASYPIISAYPEMRMRLPIGTSSNSLLSSIMGMRGAKAHSPPGKVIEIPFTG